MKSLLFLLTLIAALGAAGCDSHEIGGAPVGEELPFDLILPTNQTPADYYAESGIMLRTENVLIGDSVVKKTSSSYYAQFRAARGNKAPAVTINGNPLTPLRSGSDTLRLGTISGSSLYNENNWMLRDSTTGDSASFITSKVEGIDSVAPFYSKSSFRRDTSITVTWKRPTTGASGMYITWIGSSYTYTQPVNDNIGVYEIPAEVVKKLGGKSKIYFTRHITLEKNFKGKNIILKRMVQRVYEVTVD